MADIVMGRQPAIRADDLAISRYRDMRRGAGGLRLGQSRA